MTTHLLRAFSHLSGQVRVVGLCQLARRLLLLLLLLLLAGPQLQALDRSVLHQTPTATGIPARPQLQALDSRTQCSPLDLSRNLWIKVFPVGPQLQALDRSVPHRTRTATSGSK